MRRSFPITLALAAFTMAGACGTASAINPTPSAPPAKPAVTDTKRKVPAVQNLSTSTAATVTVAKTKPKVSATQNVSTSTAAVAVTDAKAPAVQVPSTANASATIQNTAAHASSTTLGSTIANAATGTMTTGLPHGYTPQPVDNPKKDIAKQGQVIKQAEDDIVKLQETKRIADKYASDFFGRHYGPILCAKGGSCLRSFISDKFGGPGVTIWVRVDAKGNLLPGEFEKALEAEKNAVDLAIDQRTQLISNAKTQMDFDLASLPPPGNGGADLHRNGPIHQQ